MMKKTIATIALVLGIAGLAAASARDRFSTTSLRGRYTGNIAISESIPLDESTVLKIEARQLLALTFDAKSNVTGITSVTALIPNSPPTVFTCVFTIEGTYELSEEGLGTATLNITPTTACSGPATLKLSLLVGGRNRNRLDVSIDGASGLGAGDVQIAILGSGTLTEN